MGKPPGTRVPPKMAHVLRWHPRDFRLQAACGAFCRQQMPQENEIDAYGFSHDHCSPTLHNQYLEQNGQYILTVLLKPQMWTFGPASAEFQGSTTRMHLWKSLGSPLGHGSTNFSGGAILPQPSQFPYSGGEMPKSVRNAPYVLNFMCGVQNIFPTPYQNRMHLAVPQSPMWRAWDRNFQEGCHFRGNTGST